MLRDPYIGITDFMTREQVEHMLAVLRANLRPGQQRRLHVGVMMSHKTLHGEETKWTAAFPRNEAIAGIFGSSEAMNCLHFVGENQVLYEDLVLAIGYGGAGMNALQLDMAWPDPDQIQRAVLASDKQLEVVLQVGGNAIRQAGDSPVGVVERLRRYEEVIQWVLLDKSMGAGIPMDAVGLIPYVEAIKETFPDLGVAVAGGLGPKTMHLVAPLAKLFPGISIDAQGRLRPSNNALYPVDWDMAAEYLTKALRLLD